jgi:hypothetical protein
MQLIMFRRRIPCLDSYLDKVCSTSPICSINLNQLFARVNFGTPNPKLHESLSSLPLSKVSLNHHLCFAQWTGQYVTLAALQDGLRLASEQLAQC